MSSSRSDQSAIYGLFHDRAALLILAVSLVVRLLLSATVQPGFDESYYHVFGLNLAGGYFDHPPLVAITAGLGRWLTGWQHPVTLRFGAVLWFTFTLAGFYSLARAMYNRKAGLIALLLAHTTPYFLVGAGAFVIPDNALSAAWVWGLYITWVIREEKLNRYVGFLLLGVLTGIGLLAKYHAVLLPGALFFAALFDRRIRSWFFDWRLYLFTIPVAILVFSPCLVWNAQNEWISFAEQFGKSGSGGIRLRFDLLGQALGGQAGFLTPWMMMLFWYSALRKRRHGVEDRWLLPFFLLPVIAFTLIGLTRTVLPHWTMPGYLAAVMLTAGAIANPGNYKVVTADKSSKKAWYWLSGAAVVNLLLVTTVIIQTHSGFLPIKAKQDPTLDPFGWKQTIDWLERTDRIAEDDVIFVHKWFSGSEVTWADRNRHTVVNLGSKQHMYAWWAPPEDYIGRDGIFITQGRYIRDKDVGPLLKDRFGSVTELYPPLPKRGSQLVEIRVWRVEDFRVPPHRDYGPACPVD